MPIPWENINLSENFGSYKDKKSILEKQDIEGNYRDLIGKSLDTRRYARISLSKHTF